MVIKFFGKNLFDVFVGNGWENWTRFEIVVSSGKKYLHKLAGGHVPKEQMSELRKRYTGGK